MRMVFSIVTIVFVFLLLAAFFFISGASLSLSWTQYLDDCVRNDLSSETIKGFFEWLITDFKDYVIENAIKNRTERQNIWKKKLGK